MALPKIKAPTFTVKLPSNNKKCVLRPFTVREEKILLIAREAKDPSVGIQAIKQVITNCIEDKTDVNTLPTIDFEYLLISLRSRSVDNIINFQIVDDETKETVKLTLNLDHTEVVRPAGHTNAIKLTNDSSYTLFLRYPTFDEFSSIMDAMASQDETSMAEISYQVLRSCLETLANEDEVYKFSEFSEEEIDEFMDDLSGNDIVAIREFFDTTPTLRHTLKYTNSLGNERSYVIEGTNAFFI